LPIKSRQVFFAKLPFKGNIREAKSRLKNISINIDSALINARERSRQRTMLSREQIKNEYLILVVRSFIFILLSNDALDADYRRTE